MICQKCETDNPDIAQFCRQCGEQMVLAQKPEAALPATSQANRGLMSKFASCVGWVVIFGIIIILIGSVLGNC